MRNAETELLGTVMGRIGADGCIGRSCRAPTLL